MANPKKHKSEEILERDRSGEFEETNTYVERWEEFEDMFDQFDPIPDHLEAAWWDSEVRQRRMEEVQKLLEGEKRPPFDDEELVRGLRDSLGYFSYVQLMELKYFAKRCGEGLAMQRAEKSFEKSAEAEKVDAVLTIDAAWAESQALFNALVEKFYTLVARMALKGMAEEEFRGLINVSWTAIQTCVEQIKKALDEGKSPTEIRLIILRFDQQLDALDPEHAFVPSETISSKDS